MYDEPIKRKADPFSYEEIAHSLKTAVKIAPIKQESQMTENEKAF
jgi:hypothetical protein